MKQIDKPGLKRFFRYSVVGFSTFLFDLVLLVFVIELLDVNYLIATPIAFAIAVTINYAISRKYVFVGTERAYHHGYLYFVGIAAMNAALVTGIVTLLIEFAGQHYFTARIITAGFIGFLSYILNLYHNFKVVGRHH
jgi:putative flippase GtrA